MILEFDFKSQTPLYMQLRNQVVNAIASGELKAGEHLPSVRALSNESGINTMTVSKAYQLLKQEGYIDTDRRRGTTVLKRDEAVELSPETVENFRLCLSELRLAGLNREQIIALCEKLCKEEK